MVSIRPAVDGCSGIRPATVGCRVACAPRAHKQRLPHVARERRGSLAYTPRTKYASAYKPEFASVTCEVRCPSPTRASGGRTAAASKRAKQQKPSQGRIRKIRHWEVTARVDKAFLSFFWICLIFLIFLLTWREHAWGLGAFVEVVRGRASTYGLHNRTAASLDARGPRRARPDLAADSGCRRVRRARGRL